MATLLLSQTIHIEEDKEFSDILNTVDINRKEPLLLLSSMAVANKYKEVSEEISSVNVSKKNVRRKSIKAMMQESVFHGAGWMGRNFIA